MKSLGVLLLLVTCYVAMVRADYDCMCCYTVEQKVYDEARSDSKPVGYMYEFDCKKIVTNEGSGQHFIAIEFEHQLCYVEQGPDMQREICPGDPPDTDKITTSMPSSTMSPRLSTTLSTPLVISTTAATTTTYKTSTVPSTSTPKMTPTSTISTTRKSPVPTSTSKATSPKISTLSSTVSTPSRTTDQTTTKATPTTQPSSSQVPSTIMTTTTIPLSTVSHIANVNTTNSPLRYVGIGYDLYHGNPAGMGQDPGLLLSNRIFQLTDDMDSLNSTAREVDVKVESSCTNHQETVVVNDGLAYQHELLRHITFSGSYSLSPDNDAFLYNTELMQVRHDTEETHTAIYTDKITTCYLGSLRYKDETFISDGFSITRDYARDVCSLDKQFNVTQYMDFLDNWGTNVVMQIQQGTINVERYKTTERTLIERLQQLPQKDAVLHHSGQYKGYDSSVTVNTTSLATLTVPGIFGTLMTTASRGTPAVPAPIALTLYPITETLNPKYWTMALTKSGFSDICGAMSDSKLTSIKTNLEMALKKYSVYLRTKENLQNYQPLAAHTLQMPLTWPHGTYGLMKSAGGCPTGKVSWQESFRKYDTEDIRSHNFFSPDIQKFMAGSYAADNLVTLFCMKTVATVDTTYEREWPRGTYCILKYGVCPTQFTEGYIYWDDDDGIPPFEGNHNDEGGVLPFGSYGDNTKIYYCCRNDAPETTPLFMPLEKPFILLKFSQTCQQVHGMLVHELFVRWDDEDVGNKDSAGGAHPFDDGGSDDHLLHFCYYSRDDKAYPVNNVIVG